MYVDFYIVDNDYLNYLRNFDSRVSMNHNNAKQRPFVSILASCLGVDYLIPLTHKRKSRTLGTLPLNIKRGTNIHNFGTLLINNMIPFRADAARRLVINSVSDFKYKILLRNQWSILREEKFRLRLEKAVVRAYAFQTNQQNSNNPIYDNFIDYKLLESKAAEYIKQ
ncbi:MAG TPA: hypothetical protein GXX71_00945 [Acholeplasma sp.]|nr:hypothetical protein [Acholeplasma sp.]